MERGQERYPGARSLCQSSSANAKKKAKTTLISPNFHRRKKYFHLSVADKEKPWNIDFSFLISLALSITASLLFRSSQSLAKARWPAAYLKLCVQALLFPRCSLFPLTTMKCFPLNSLLSSTAVKTTFRKRLTMVVKALLMPNHIDVKLIFFSCAVIYSAILSLPSSIPSLSPLSSLFFFTE